MLSGKGVADVITSQKFCAAFCNWQLFSPTSASSTCLTRLVGSFSLNVKYSEKFSRRDESYLGETIKSLLFRPFVLRGA